MLSVSILIKLAKLLLCQGAEKDKRKEAVEKAKKVIYFFFNLLRILMD